MSDNMRLEIMSIAKSYGVSQHIVEKSVASLMMRGKEFSTAKKIVINHIVADTKRIDPTRYSYNPNKL